MELRSYQQDISTQAAELIRQYNIAYLSVEVRCGKTLMALATCDKLGKKNILFITRKKAISSIEDDHKMLESPAALAVINYEQAHNYLGTPDIVILDEAHNLGQYPVPAGKTKLVKKICEGLPIIYLSGTPSAESYSQLFHQFWVSSFSPFPQINFYKWAMEYVRVGKKYFHGVAINDYSKADKPKIDEATSHLFISYTQAEAGFEHEVQEEVISVRMMPTTYSLIKKLKANRIYTGKNGEVILADTAVKLMNKMLQVYSGTVILEAGASGISSIVFDKSKVSFIAEHFAGQKIGIFYKFKAEEIMIRAHLGRPITTDPKEFNESQDKIFISQIQSGKEGINLSTADTLVFINLDFSSVSYWQARARLQDKNRITPAKVCWVFAENGLEHEVYKRVRDKRDFTLNYFKRYAGIEDTKGNFDVPGEKRVACRKDNQLHERRMAGPAGP